MAEDEFAEAVGLFQNLPDYSEQPGVEFELAMMLLEGLELDERQRERLQQRLQEDG
jgi:hypothetical protein